jgi:hypothetical protein
LKKQSQFVGRQIGVKPYKKGYYDIITLIGAQKNKANVIVFSLLFIVHRKNMERNLKKQTQFVGRQNELKYLDER